MGPAEGTVGPVSNSDTLRQQVVTAEVTTANICWSLLSHHWSPTTHTYYVLLCSMFLYIVRSYLLIRCVWMYILYIAYIVIDWKYLCMDLLCSSLALNL